MAKRKETFFERLAKKNANHENASSTKVKKRKSWKVLVFGSLLTLAVIVGVTVPLVITGTKTTYNDKEPDTKVIYSFKSPVDNTEIFTITFGDLEKSNQNETEKKYQDKLDQLYRLAIYYLYEKEAKASKEYQKLLNASRKSGTAEVNNIALKSIAELKTQYQNELLDLKENTIKKYGFSNWETEFNNLLISNYEGATTIDEAVDKKVFNEIQNDALRRFRLSTSSVKDLLERVANNDIHATDENGRVDTNKILFKKGEKVFPWLKEITETDKNGNYFQFDDQYMGFMTESFDTNHKDALSFIKYYLNNDNPYLFSQFTLPGIAKVKNSDNWTVDRNFFKYLMYAWPVRSNDETAPIYSYQMVKDFFKPFSEYVTILNDENSSTLPLKARYYSDILNKLSKDTSELKNNFGTKGISSLTTLLTNSDEALKAFTTIPELLGSEEIKTIDLFGKLKEIQEAIASDQSITLPTYSDADTLDKKKEVLTQFNEAMKDAFDKTDDVNEKGLYTDKYKKLVTAKLAELFEIGPEVDGKKQIYTLYKLKDSENFVLLTKNGITLLNTQTLGDTVENQQDQILKMIKNDFVLSNKFKQLSGVKYNALATINTSLTNKQNVIRTMLSDNEFVNYLKEQTNIYATDENGSNLSNAKYDDVAIEELLSINNNVELSTNSEKALTITKNVNEWMKTRAQNGADANFVIKNNKTYFANNNSNFEKTADNLLNEKLKELLNLFKNR